MAVFQNKNFVFFVSTGRTGTKFFGDLLSNMIPEAFSVHEPDVLMDFKIKSLQQIRTFGVYNLIFGKLTGKTGIRNLSQNFLAGKIDREQLVAAIVDHRRNFYEQLKSNLVIESYSGWYGAIPGIRQLYRNYKIVAIVRDPRTWVTSNMNWGTMYGHRDWITRLGLGRLSPQMIGDERYASVWKDFSRFQKLCWAWQAINRILLEAVVTDENAILIKFEDLFKASNRYQHLENLLAFIASFDQRTFAFRIPNGVLERKIHPTRNACFPAWPEWKPQQKRELYRICGSLMESLGYE
jgi:hypothetical protein